MDEEMSEAQRVETARQIGDDMAALRERRPLVQNITNFVSMDIVANALLAAGASPAMVHAPEEIEEFGALIDALAINIGTLSSPWATSMEAAARGADRRKKPWVLDPVGVGATTFRNATVAKLLEHRPSVIRGNASEILAVAKISGLDAAASLGKGVDSGNSAEEAAEVAGRLARTLGCTVMATAEIDIVTDGSRMLRFGNGSSLMTLVTAIGCSLSALTAAYCAVTEPFAAASAAVAHVGIAGQLAEEDAKFPGLFRVAFVDRLASVGETEVLEHLVAA